LRKWLTTKPNMISPETRRTRRITLASPSLRRRLASSPAPPLAGVGREDYERKLTCKSRLFA
jgi:hypothetical protein